MIAKTQTGHTDFKKTETTTKRRKRGLLFWMSRGLLGMVVGLFALTISGFAFETVMLSGDAERYPPPGQIIVVDDYDMHFKCEGEAQENDPTIIMIVGAGGLSYQDMPIQQRLSPLVRTCVYDRAGYLWSAARPEPRTAWQLMDELHALLEAAQIQPPYILVGASNGGIYARTYYSLYPEEVAGLVMVDSNSEMELGSGQRLSTEVLQAMGRVGLFRLLPGMICPENVCDPQYAEEIAVFRGYVGNLETYEREWQDGLDTAEQIDLLKARIGAVGALAHTPLVILHANQTGIPEDQMEPRYREFVERYRAHFTGLSSNTRYMLINSGHGLAVEQPEVVVEAVADMLEFIRTGNTQGFPD